MQMEEDQPESADTGGGAGTELSSFVAAGDHMVIHLSSSTFTQPLGDTRTASKSSIVLVEEPD